MSDKREEPKGCCGIPSRFMCGCSENATLRAEVKFLKDRQLVENEVRQEYLERIKTAESQAAALAKERDNFKRLMEETAKHYGDRAHAAESEATRLKAERDEATKNRDLVLLAAANYEKEVNSELTRLKAEVERRSPSTYTTCECGAKQFYLTGVSAEWVSYACAKCGDSVEDFARKIIGEQKAELTRLREREKGMVGAINKVCIPCRPVKS